VAKSGYVDRDNPNINYSDLFGQVIFVYKNHEGFIEERRVTPIEVVFKKTMFHDEAQWFLHAYCHQRLDKRDFALEDIIGNIRHVRRRNNDAKRTVLSHQAKKAKFDKLQLNSPDLTKDIDIVTIEHKK